MTQTEESGTSTWEPKALGLTIVARLGVRESSDSAPTPRIVDEDSDPDSLGETELSDVLEERSMRYFGVSFDEFLRRRRRDSLPDSPAALSLELLAGARTSS